MFEFKEKFDELTNDKVHLKIIEKFPGDDIMIPFYYYDIYENKYNEKVGKISIRIGYNYHSYYNGHIGYEIDEKFRGNNYSLYASRIVLQVAKEHGMKSINLSCKESNIASRKIIEYLGCKLIEIIDVPKEYFGWYDGIEKQCIYELILK
ncbi:Acetyltransferase (GNAT) domain-containing protein [Clostridium collagenovorans DSM 3089]|uniref:Acetyltransferase (GNAT) domain-containing protein n=1 Tax=Clostridium collagenovorans DSM 3089 TaxID=1121306 RepID=A0A1M5UUR4_9CLOT|nr:GNAT family N-acetyltransferase [Clostridium collagenovorans]SHH66493.1 Acetyltransferase (GNAT) domain-containing protein [Clostridium collagenovorans DSM 3089]